MDSNGMVMCALNKAHTECVFLRPNENTKLGSRLIIKDHPVPKAVDGPISNNHLKKILEYL
jgi:hypothetical protein